MEIERKYLVKEIPGNLNEYPSKKIIQGYISTSPTIRIRKIDNEYILTIKGSGLLARDEFELPISAEEFASLLKKVETKLIEKDRYFIPLANGLTAELDIYYNFLEGLITVEVEFKSVEQAKAFTPPNWFGEDVTYDKKYSNSNLSVNGL